METAGDAYLAAAGLLPPRPPAESAAAALLFGLRVHAAAAAVGLPVRVGVHVGPVTAGLVGRVRARFCVFGDSVNTSARLEAASAPGCVQASACAWALAGLPPAQPPAARTLQLKGKAAPMDAVLLSADTPLAASTEAALEAVLARCADARACAGVAEAAPMSVHEE